MPLKYYRTVAFNEDEYALLKKIRDEDKLSSDYAAMKHAIVQYTTKTGKIFQFTGDKVEDAKNLDKLPKSQVQAFMRMYKRQSVNKHNIKTHGLFHDINCQNDLASMVNEAQKQNRILPISEYKWHVDYHYKLNILAEALLRRGC